MRETWSSSASISGSANVLIRRKIGLPKRATGGPPCVLALYLLRFHERIAIIQRRRERFLDGAWAYPAHQIELRAGLVVGSAASGSAERLLSHHRAGGLVVDVEVSRGIAEQQRCLSDRLAVAAENRSGERIGRSLVDDPERFLPPPIRVDVVCYDRAEDLFAEQPVAGVLRLDECGLDEIPIVTAGNAAGENAGVGAAVVEELADLREGFPVDDGAHEIPKVRHVAHLQLLHDPAIPVT